MQAERSSGTAIASTVCGRRFSTAVADTVGLTRADRLGRGQRAPGLHPGEACRPSRGGASSSMTIRTPTGGARAHDPPRARCRPPRRRTPTPGRGDRPPVTRSSRSARCAAKSHRPAIGILPPTFQGDAPPGRWRCQGADPQGGAPARSRYRLTTRSTGIRLAVCGQITDAAASGLRDCRCALLLGGTRDSARTPGPASAITDRDSAGPCAPTARRRPTQQRARSRRGALKPLRSSGSSRLDVRCCSPSMALAGKLGAAATPFPIERERSRRDYVPSSAVACWNCPTNRPRASPV